MFSTKLSPMNTPIKAAEDYVNKFVMQDTPELVVLTGSASLGYMTETSDIDLCIIGKYPKRFIRKPVPDYTHLLKYPEEFEGYAFEVEYQTKRGIQTVMRNVLSFHDWKFKNSVFLGGKRELFEQMQKPMKNDELVRGRVRLYHGVLDILWRVTTPIEHRLALARASQMLIQLVFLINEQPIPSEKWMMNEYKKLAFQPEGLLNDIQMTLEEGKVDHIQQAHRKLGIYLKTHRLIPELDIQYIEHMGFEK